MSDFRFVGSDRSANDSLFLGWYGGATLYQIDSGGYYLGTDPGISPTFSPAATPVPFDFDPSFGVVALGGIWAGRKVIKKIKTSKKSV